MKLERLQGKKSSNGEDRYDYDGKRLERQDLNPALTCKNRHSPPRGYLKNVDPETRLGHTGSGKQTLLATGFSWLSGSSTNFARQLNLYRYRGANGPPGGAAELTVAAPTATTWQSLYDLYWTLAIAAGTITIGALVFFAIKYRSKTGVRAPSQTDEKTPLRPVIIIILIMAIILSSVAFESFQAIALYNSRLNDPNAIHVSVTAQRFSWSFNCTSGCGVAGVLTVPHNTTVILDITSIDVFHSFGIPALRVKADAIPGRTNTIWFSAPVGTYRIQCYELCGNGHAFMIAKLNVV